MLLKYTPSDFPLQLLTKAGPGARVLFPQEGHKTAKFPHPFCLGRGHKGIPDLPLPYSGQKTLLIPEAFLAPHPGGRNAA